MKRIAFITTLFLLLFCFSVSADTYFLTKNAKLYNTIDKKHAILTLPKGTPVTITKTCKGDMYQVKYRGIKGYIDALYIRKPNPEPTENIDEISPGYYTINTDPGARVRKYPNGHILTSLKRGATVYATGIIEDISWVEITFPINGWIDVSHVELEPAEWCHPALPISLWGGI